MERTAHIEDGRYQAKRDAAAELMRQWADEDLIIDLRDPAVVDVDA